MAEPGIDVIAVAAVAAAAAVGGEELFVVAEFVSAAKFEVGISVAVKRRTPETVGVAVDRAYRRTKIRSRRCVIESAVQNELLVRADKLLAS